MILKQTHLERVGTMTQANLKRKKKISIQVARLYYYDLDVE